MKLVVLQENQSRALVVMLGPELERNPGDKAHMLLSPSNKTRIRQIRQALGP